MKPETTNAVLGILAGLIIGLVFQEGRVDAAKDHEYRIETQYHDCAMVGDFPGHADLPPGQNSDIEKMFTLFGRMVTKAQRYDQTQHAAQVTDSPGE